MRKEIPDAVFRTLLQLNQKQKEAINTFYQISLDNLAQAFIDEKKPDTAFTVGVVKRFINKLM